jgi:hypothetical protein
VVWKRNYDPGVAIKHFVSPYKGTNCKISLCFQWRCERFPDPVPARNLLCLHSVRGNKHKTGDVQIIKTLYCITVENICNNCLVVKNIKHSLYSYFAGVIFFLD